MTCDDLVPLIDGPKLNFYQYPPPTRLGVTEQKDLISRLDLESSLPDPRLFTIFVSIPFCRVKCNSCPFFKALLPPNVHRSAFLDPYVAAIEQQLLSFSQTPRFRNAKCAAMYIGGGTASLLSPHQLNRLWSAFTENYRHTRDVEVTLEGNPSDFTNDYLRHAVDIGITRVSLGYQSELTHILVDKLGSPHDASQATQALSAALQTGFRTVNIDMLYGIPGQTMADWDHDLRLALEYDPQSITIYSYTVHRHSRSEQRISNGTLEPPITADTKHSWYLHAQTLLTASAYSEHRQGNFVKPGHMQQYSNFSYCRSVESIGIGAGAYSFVNGYIFKSTKGPSGFQKALSEGRFIVADKQSVQATGDILMSRYIIGNLATGHISMADFTRLFGRHPEVAYRKVFKELYAKNLVTKNGAGITLTLTGRRWLQNIQYAFSAPELRSELLPA